MRKIISLNSGWSFTKEGDTLPVALPHTWNALDGADGGNDYYRGTCVYEKILSAEELPGGEVCYLEVLAANASAEVRLNGKSLLTHDGGYSLFRVCLGKPAAGDTLSIAVDNGANDRVYPQMADTSAAADGISILRITVFPFLRCHCAYFNIHYLSISFLWFVLKS